MELTNGDQKKAEVLAGFFTSVFTVDLLQIPELEARTIKHKFNDELFNEEDVLKLLNDINPNKSPGPDGLQPKPMQ